jgi:hypothetical protein
MENKRPTYGSFNLSRTRRNHKRLHTGSRSKICLIRQDVTGSSFNATGRVLLKTGLHSKNKCLFITVRIEKRDIFPFLEIDGAARGNICDGCTKRQ